MSDAALFSLPKAELHCHLELAFRRSTLKRWAVDRGMDVGDDAAFDKAFLVKAPMEDLPSVLHKFLNTRDVIDTEDKVEQLTYEVCADMHQISNVRVLELRYAPSFLLDAHPGMDADRMLEAIQRGVARAEREFPMVVGLIGLLQRIKSVEDNARWCDWILERKVHFVGLDLADDEVNYPAQPFAPLFQKAKAQGLGITVHAENLRCRALRETSWWRWMNWGRTASVMACKPFTTRKSSRVWCATASPSNCVLEQRADPSRSLLGSPPLQATARPRRAHHPQHRRPRRHGHQPDGRMPKRHEPPRPLSKP